MSGYTDSTLVPFSLKKVLDAVQQLDVATGS